MAILKTELLNLLVDNEFGVLTRITAAIRREGWNIKSLSVAETNHPERSALSICVEYYEATLERLLRRLDRMESVRQVSVYREGTHAARELVLLGLAVRPDNLGDLKTRYGVRLFEQRSQPVLEFSGDPDEADALLAELAGNVRSVMRTGAIFLGGAPEEEPS